MIEEASLRVLRREGFVEKLDSSDVLNLAMIGREEEGVKKLLDALTVLRWEGLVDLGAIEVLVFKYPYIPSFRKVADLPECPFEFYLCLGSLLIVRKDEGLIGLPRSKLERRVIEVEGGSV